MSSDRLRIFKSLRIPILDYKSRAAGVSPRTPRFKTQSGILEKYFPPMKTPLQLALLLCALIPAFSQPGKACRVTSLKFISLDIVLTYGGDSICGGTEKG